MLTTPVKRVLASSCIDGDTPEKLRRWDRTKVKAITNFWRVHEFHEAFGVLISETPRYGVFVEDPKTVKLRLSLVEEEVKELEEAIGQQDFVETVDALTDILYVTYGAGVSFGVDLDVAFRTAHNRQDHESENEALEALEAMEAYGMSEALRSLAKTNFKDNLKASEESTNVTNFVLAGAEQRPLGMPIEKGLKADVSRTFPQVMKLWLKTIRGQVGELKCAIEDSDFAAVVDALVGILYSSYSAGVAFEADLDAAFDIVHRSNMSKLCKTEDIAQATVAKYEDMIAKGDKKYDSPAYRRASDGKHWVVYNEPTGKVLKSMLWAAPDFTAIGVRNTAA